jgi:hypothetical protein
MRLTPSFKNNAAHHGLFLRAAEGRIAYPAHDCRSSEPTASFVLHRVQGTPSLLVTDNARSLMKSRQCRCPIPAD